MTIEFRCPYCTAAIQVADALADTIGRCPKCAARLTIPRPAGLVAPPKPEAPLPVPSAPLPTPEPVASAFEPVAPAIDVGLPLEHAPAATAGPIVRRRRKRKPVPLGVVVAVLVLLVGTVAGGGGWSLYRDWQSRQLVGELAAIELDYVELQPATIDRSEIAVPEAERGVALQELQRDPVPMVSDLMQVQFRGSQAGLVVSIARGTKSMWYRVETRSLPVLAKFIEVETEPLRVRRNEGVAQAATGFVRQFQAVTSKQATEDSLLPYRDKLGLTSLVRGLGIEAVAVVGQNMYPCVYEEANGTLYFLLPPKVKQFQLQGRKSPDGHVRFAGRFTVQVKSRRVDEGREPPDLRKPTEDSSARDQRPKPGNNE